MPIIKQLFDPETKELMNDYDLDADQAEEVQDLMEETGLDIDEAVELYEEM